MKSDLTSTCQPICSVLVWWGDPMWQPPPSHLLTPHQRDGGGNWKGKSQEKSLMGQDKDSLISGEVITHSRRLMPSQSLSKETPPLHSFTADHDVIWCAISLWSAGVSCPGFVPSQPSRCGSRVRKREGLDAVQALISNSSNVSVFSTLFWPPTQSTAP